MDEYDPIEKDVILDMGEDFIKCEDCPLPI